MCMTTMASEMSICGPADGTIEWKQTMELLRSAPNVPALVLEIEGVEGEKISAKMAEGYGKLEG